VVGVVAFGGVVTIAPVADATVGFTGMAAGAVAGFGVSAAAVATDAAVAGVGDVGAAVLGGGATTAVEVGAGLLGTLGDVAADAALGTVANGDGASGDAVVVATIAAPAGACRRSCCPIRIA
jgi:hypothetical protein